MKVAYVLGIFPKLSESFIINEIVELIKKGHEVLIFSFHSPEEDIKHETVGEYNLLERTYYFSFNQIFKVNLFILSGYFLRGFVNDLWNLKISNNILTLNLKAAYFAVIIRKKNVDMVHTHFATMGVFSKKICNILGLPYTLTAHAFDIYMNPDNDELRNVMENAKRVITISEYNKNYLKNRTGIKNNIEVVRCGIDIEKFNPRTKSTACDRIKILTVTRLVEKKGMDYLIRAIPIVIKDMQNFDLTIVGSGPLNDHLHQLSHELNIEKYIQFKGDVSDFELKHYYENADMFILPCIIAENGDRDGVPVAIMEAMAMELPVISTNISGIPELVEDGVSGILVSQKDENAVGNAIIKLCKDRALRTGMGENGRKIIEKKFNITSESDKLISIFNKLRN